MKMQTEHTGHDNDHHDCLEIPHQVSYVVYDICSALRNLQTTRQERHEIQ
jgi:hypothetical protein